MNEKSLDPQMVNQILALAGVVQAAKLVDQLARTGYDDNEILETQIYALLQTDPESTEATFKDRFHLRPGLTALKKLLDQESDEDLSNIMRYTLSAIHLERKLNNRKDMLGIIGSRLEQAKSQADHFEQTHDNVIANLASIYEDTISTLSFRIQVNGEPMYLQQENIVRKIRCLLLSAIRSAVLWRQNGGTRIKVLFKRQKMAETCDALLRLN